MKCCERCGRELYAYHVVRGRKVCRDDRLCYAKEKEPVRVTSSDKLNNNKDYTRY